MSNNPSNIETQQLLNVLKKAGKGLKISQIETLLPEAMTRRTLQRRLAELKTKKVVITHGIKSGVEYFLTNQQINIPLSKSSEKLKLKISQPLNTRKPVGYNYDFLFSYEPNKTFYLSEEIRAHLQNIGQQFHQKLEPGTYVKSILNRLLIDLSWNSSRLEGNTYSLLETERLIEFGALASGKDALEAQMIINHKEAIEFMVEQIEFGLTKQIIFNIHSLLSNNLIANPQARGQIRKVAVGIGQAVYYPIEIPHVLEECFNAILEKAKKITDPFEQAFFLMVQLPYLQPFEDINKRVSRLSANIPLMQNNLAPLSFIDVPHKDYIGGLLAIYELNNTDYLRDVFIWAYERSAEHYKLVRNIVTEPNLIVMRYRKTLSELVNFVVNQNLKGEAIIKTVAQWSKKHVEPKDQEEFIRIAEKEFVCLHEGNIAIYKITLDTFSQWHRK